MYSVLRNIMAGRQRNYTPRVRSSRPVGESRSTNLPPMTTLPTPVSSSDGWYLPAPLAQRLHEKSAIGKITSDSGIHLTVEEVMYCHWYRHVPLPLPEVAWFEQRLREDPRAALRTIAMDVLRNGGERVVPVCHLKERFSNLHPATWAIRWERQENWTQHQGCSQVRLHHTHDELDWEELYTWVNRVKRDGHVAELCVVDAEFDATVYHLSIEQPQGTHHLFSSLPPGTQKEIQLKCGGAVKIDDGFFLTDTPSWPLTAIGIEHFSGRFLRNEEYRYLLGINESIYDTLFRELANAGLLMRPGFKYGCRWRVYASSIEDEHAPWLVQPSDDAPTNWEGVCLAVRLAEGVNKKWICAKMTSKLPWFLQIERRG